LAKDDVEGQYIRMTGTSVSAAMVSGVAALTLAAHPDYTPTKVKGAIAASGRAVSGSITPAVDAAKALSAMTDVNVKVAPSKLLLKRLTELGVGGSGTTWEGVSWEGVSWEGVSWETVSWETVSWEGVIWEAVSWE
jgi:serine protease AprX